MTRASPLHGLLSRNPVQYLEPEPYISPTKFLLQHSLCLLIGLSLQCFPLFEPICLPPWSLSISFKTNFVIEREGLRKKEKGRRGIKRKRERNGVGGGVIEATFKLLSPPFFSSEVYKRPFTASLQRHSGFRCKANRQDNWNKQPILGNPSIKEFVQERWLYFVIRAD